MENVKLKFKTFSETSNDIIMLIMEDVDLSASIEVKRQRLIKSNACYIIEYCNNNVGYLILIDEYDTEQIHAIDIGIKKEYQHLGIGRKALKLLKEFENFYNFKVYAEVAKENIASNKLFIKEGFKLFDDNNTNFYSLSNIENSFDDSIDLLKKSVFKMPQPKQYRRGYGKRICS